MAVINDVVFCYTKLAQADFKYQSKTEKEWSVDCVVDKATAKKWNKEFPKQKAKEIDSDDFEKIFKISPPYAGDEQYVIKLKKNAQYFKGEEMHPTPDAYRPRVFVPGSDGKLQDVTKDILVANGSKGVVSFDTVENSFGRFAQLKAIRVDELIEYKKEGGASFDELGEVGTLASDFSDVPEREMSEVQKAQREEEPEAKTPRKKSSPKVEEPTEDFGGTEDDIPFAPIGLQEGRSFLHMI